MRFAATRLRRYVEEACDGPFGSAIASEHYVNEGARVIRLGNIGSAEWLDEDRTFLALSYWATLSQHHASPGDLVVAALGDQRNPVGRAAVVPALGPALVKADCHRLRLRSGTTDARFLAYWLSSDQGRFEAGRMADGSTRKRLTLGKTLGLPVPDLLQAEQQAIADFLDTETARIDALMTRKRELIERLLEHRQATTLAGVRGDLTTAEVGPAADGMPWMPLHTAGWPAARLTLVAQLGSGHTPSRDHPEWWDDCSIPWITTGEVAQMRHDRIEYLTETREMISAAGIANSSATIHPAGTVVLSRTASAGFSAIMGIPMATSQDFVTWTCGPLLEPRYLLLCLRAMRTDLLERLAQGSTHKTIYMPDVESIRIPLPPIDEQRKIVEETWRRLKPLDRSVDRLNRQVALLQERRQALITAAVTGELGVAEAG